MFKTCILSIVLYSLTLIALEPESNVLIYGDPQIEINSEISAYETLLPDTPIQGTVMITHASKDAIDAKSFYIGDQPLSVHLVQSVPMTAEGNLVVNIYQFQLPGMKQGYYTLPSIKVKVAGKEYYAAPLSIQIGNSL